MGKSATLTVRLDLDTKERAASVVEGLGVDLSSAVRMFLTQVALRNEIPLSLSFPAPNKTSAAAIDEVETMVSDGSGKKFSNIDDLFDDLGI
ncbi:MAG: type II toxin-antitoxin system RelB/DinJ family antitoxin [Eggerthellaceae bacterium]